MTLDELIEKLETMPPDAVPPIGFANPHSYRGYYNDLAFEPAEGVSFGEMLKAAKEAKGQTMEGYKGGDYVMHGYVDCYLAHYGSTGEGIGPVLLNYMKWAAKTPSEEE